MLMCSPGSAADKQQGIKLIAECINQAHSETKSVKVVLENSAGGTNSIGTQFEDLRGIIDHVKGIPVILKSIDKINLEWEFASIRVMHLLLVGNAR
jgi:endonuclease IV